MASADLCQQLLREASAVVVRRVSEDEIQAMTASWARAFDRTKAALLAEAFEAWFEGLGPDARVDTLPTAAKIQVHLAAVVRRGSGSLPYGPAPASFQRPRPEFLTSLRVLAEEAKEAGLPLFSLGPGGLAPDLRLGPSIRTKHDHRPGLYGLEGRQGCPRCEEIDHVQKTLTEMVGRILLPAEDSARPCRCDGSGWIDARDGSGCYPCRTCRPEAFERFLHPEPSKEPSNA
jgi:hypothetical protein